MISYYSNHRCSPYYDIFSLSPLDRIHRRKYEIFHNPRRILTREFDTETEFQLQIYKSWAGYDDYEVTVVRDRNGLSFLKVTSQRDRFVRRYEIDVPSVDLENIRWELNKSHNILELHVPKISSDISCRRHNRKLKHRHRSRRQRTHKPSREEVAVASHHFSGSEAETPSEEESSESATESNGEDSHTDSISSTKSSRRYTPMLEEIEDEEFTILRKELGGR